MATERDEQPPVTRAQAATPPFDVNTRVAQLSAAVRERTAAGQRRQAAMACVELGQTYEYALGNLTAARAWFARATRLIEQEPPCVEQGWVAIAAMGCDVDDPASLLARAEHALELARRFGDVNLETKALADAGLAHVQSGRTSQGMALLDEAMALACGPANNSWAAAKSVCSFFTACYHAADFARASTWTEPLKQHGLIGAAAGGAIFLSSHCDSVQATLLMELGRWGEAEAVLLRSIEAFEALMPIPAWHPAIALADLRVQQARLDEAEELLLGKDQALQALLPMARLHLARGDAALARAAAQRGLRGLGGDCLRAIELFIVVVEAALLLGEHDAALQAARELDSASAAPRRADARRTRGPGACARGAGRRGRQGCGAAAGARARTTRSSANALVVCAARAGAGARARRSGRPRRSQRRGACRANSPVRARRRGGTGRGGPAGAIGLVDFVERSACPATSCSANSRRSLVVGQL